MTEKGSRTLQYVDLPSAEFAQELSGEELSVLQTINQKVAAANSIEEVLDFVYRSTRSISPCDRIGIALLIRDKESHRMAEAECVRADYKPIMLVKGYAERLEDSSLAKVIISGKPRIINDLAAYLDENPNSFSTRLILREGIRSSLTCPLIVENRPVGFLFRSCRRPFAYDHHQVRLALAVAERVSQAVEKIRHIEDLTKANQAYTEVIRFVSHELKSPLASMVMDAETLLGGYLGDLQPIQSEKIKAMVNRAHYLLGLINDYLNLDRIERNGAEANIQPGVDLVGSVIESSLEIVGPMIAEKGIAVERAFPDAPVLESLDTDLMQVVMVNLLSNAVKYGNQNGHIRIRYERTDSVFRVSVWNEGPGYPPSAQSNLFQKYSRIQTPELLKRHGTGIGLYACWRIIHMHGGSIWSQSEEGRWAEFTFEIPRSPA